LCATFVSTGLPDEEIPGSDLGFGPSMSGPLMSGDITVESEPCCDVSAFLEHDANDEYIGSLSCDGETMDLTVSLYKDEYNDCYWRVVSISHDIDELFEIGYGGESCELPTLSVPASFYGCSGTIEITRHDHLPLPEREENGQQIPYCGNCRCICSVLCVTRVINTNTVVDEFVWDEASLSWISGYEAIVLSYDQYTGDCVIELEGFQPAYIGCPDAIGVSLESTDPGSSETAYVACKQCQCVDDCNPGLATVFLTCSVTPSDTPSCISASVNEVVTVTTCAIDTYLNGPTCGLTIEVFALNNAIVTPLNPQTVLNGNCGQWTIENTEGPFLSEMILFIFRAEGGITCEAQTCIDWYPEE
jgi:hypothetical protein